MLQKLRAFHQGDFLYLEKEGNWERKRFFGMLDENDPVSESVGLEDVRLIDIYNGDRLRWEGKEDGTFFGIVRYRKSEARYYVVTKKSRIALNIHFVKKFRPLVVGNIWEQ